MQADIFLADVVYENDKVTSPGRQEILQKGVYTNKRL